jgi:5'-nucleotidase
MRPLILITNDDGVFSPGLAAAARAVRHLGELLIVAPRWQQTTMGRAFPRTEGTGAIEPVRIPELGLPAYGVTGSPAQAVAHAVLELAERRPDLCVSGINYGENLGLSLTCSGTLGAAFEANSHGIPALAVSLETPMDLQHARSYADLDWSAAERAAGRLAARILAGGLPPGACLLNLNVPAAATAATGMRLTRQSRMSPSVFLKPGPRLFEAGFQLRAGPNPELRNAEPDSDVRAVLLDQVLSVTPVGWDLSANAQCDLNLLEECDS